MNSIFYEVDPFDLAITLGATAEYASFVEGGTHKMKAQPYLGPAVQAVQEELDVRIEQAILDRLDQRLTSPEEGDQVTLEIEKVVSKDE